MTVVRLLQAESRYQLLNSAYNLINDILGRLGSGGEGHIERQDRFQAQQWEFRFPAVSTLRTGSLEPGPPYLVDRT